MEEFALYAVSLGLGMVVVPLSRRVMPEIRLMVQIAYALLTPVVFALVYQNYTGYDLSRYGILGVYTLALPGLLGWIVARLLRSLHQSKTDGGKELSSADPWYE